MTLPNARHAVVEREKVVEYLLSVSSPSGQAKAMFFLSFGFSIEHWQDFAKALRVHGNSHQVVKVVETVHGPRYHVDGAIQSPDGRNPRIRTVWQVDSGSEYPRLITAHPRRM